MVQEMKMFFLPKLCKLYLPFKIFKKKNVILCRIKLATLACFPCTLKVLYTVLKSYKEEKKLNTFKCKK